jgi:predicted  nucleic acid-binding Zn-ribbon protein
VDAVNARPTREHRRPREFPLRAAPIDQLRLLDLQEFDTRLDQLAHRRKSLPEHEEIATLDRQLTDVRALLVAAETERSDLERQQAKADADVEQVRTRKTRDESRRDSGQVSSPKELESLTHEIETLTRRQGELEDAELEIMERVESAVERLGQLTTQRDEVEASSRHAITRRDALLAEIDAEVSTNTELRKVLATQIAGDLVDLYEKLREQKDGIGAAALRQRRCNGCQLELDTTQLNQVRTADEDAVVRHEECGRILVRTPESGL